MNSNKLKQLLDKLTELDKATHITERALYMYFKSSNKQHSKHVNN